MKSVAASMKPRSDKPMRLTLELPAVVHRDLTACTEVLGREMDHAVEPAKLIAPMLARFMSTDQAFLRARREWRTTD
jgi:hypothetical protein